MEEMRFWILAAKKFSGELNSEEMRELELLLLSNNNYRTILSSLENPASQNTETSSFNKDELLQRLREKLITHVTDYPFSEDEFERGKISSKPRQRFGNRAKVLFVSFLLLLSAGVFSWKVFFDKQANFSANNSNNNISTRPGSKTQIKLPDGTLVILNADSKLTYPDNFLGNTREVNLEGEAFFEVTHNPEKPFIVHTKLMDIRVLGTVFNVRSYADDNTSEASLLKGSIQITLKNRKDEKIMLVPDEKISVSNLAVLDPIEKNTMKTAAESTDVVNEPSVAIDKIDYDTKDKTANEVAWTQNKLVFNNEDFEKIVLTLERWYGKQIVIKDLRLKGQRFTGKFKNESLEQVLKAFQLSYNFKYKTENNIIIIY
jgi:transmembrane sensor